MTQRLEQKIQRAVFEHLRWHGAKNIFAFHCANGGWRSPIEAAIFKSIGTRAGVPDVIVIKDGHTYVLELKTDTGRLTEIQRETIAAMQAAGADTLYLLRENSESVYALTHWWGGMISWQCRDDG